MFLPQEIIRAKRNGEALSSEQIQFFVDGLVNGQFNEAQAGAMAMAIFQKGMSVEETVHYTKAMMHSGDVLSWPELDGPVVDKHSTGGVGDKVSFMLAAIVASCGAYVPMIAGRGLGHTGGTVDKLESIAGFDVQPSIAEYKSIVKELNIAIIGQTSNLAPADKRLYGIRDITATVESIPLITASILSKKLAAGLDSLVMDVKVGNGAMMRNLDDANELARSIVNVANGAGVKTEAIITDMNQVLGHTAGNALEMIETVKYLTGKIREPRLHAVVVALATSMLISAGIAHDDKSAQQMIDKVLNNGEAAELFGKMIHRMGGPANYMDDPWASMQKANIVEDILAPTSGYIASVDTYKTGMGIVAIKGGRRSNSDSIDHSVGMDRVLPKGTLVNKGDVIARVHARNEDDAALMRKEYLDAVSFSEESIEVEPVIYHTIK